MSKIRLLKIISIFVICITATVALTFAINAAFRHDEPLVYVTQTGAKYHSDGCGYLWASAIPIGQYQADKSGYKPCSRCGGEPSGTVTVNNYGMSFCISAFTVGTSDFITLIIVYFLKKRLKRLELY